MFSASAARLALGTNARQIPTPRANPYAMRSGNEHMA
jgi:hypothetical protein